MNRSAFSNSASGMPSAASSDNKEGPEMTLTDFARVYHLSYSIESKLEDLKVSGPHALLFITKDQLLHEGKLELGEVADVIRAKNKWQKDTP